MFYLSTFYRFFKIKWKSALEYPGSFMMGITAQLISYAFEFFTLWIMVSAFHSMKGWSAMEVLFLYAMNLLSYGVSASFGYNICMSLPAMARSGSFDDVLIRPVHSLFYLIASNFNIGYVTHITLSAVMMAVSLASLGVAWSALHTLGLIVVVLGASLIHFSMMLLTAIPSLRILGNSKWSFLYWQLRDVANYPLSIFDGPIRLVFTFALPFAFISFFPAQPFLSKSDLLGLPRLFMYLTPAVGLLLFGLTIAVWRFTVNRYESSGS